MGIVERLGASGAFRLRDVQVPSALLEDAGLASPPALTRVDLAVAAGIVTEVIRHAGPAPSNVDAGVLCVDGGRRLLTPLLVDCHVHLDKCWIASRCPPPEGNLHAAIAATEADKPNWTEDDVRSRAERSLAAAYAAGVGVLRTHIDHPSPHASGRIAPADLLALFAQIREDWRGRIELQVATLTPLDVFRTEEEASLLASQAAEHGFVLGAFHYKHPHAYASIANLLRAADRHGLAVDFHVDEGLDADATGLAQIASAVRKLDFDGRVMCGHACSLAAIPDSVAAETIRAVAETQICVVTLPTTNAYLQDRRVGRTPTARGATLVHELASAGVPVAIATDNVGDPFYPYGDFDPVRTLGFAVPFLHLTDPIGRWMSAVSVGAGRAIGAASARKLGPGVPADFVLFDGCSPAEWLGAVGTRRTVFRRGRPIAEDFVRCDGPGRLSSRI